MSTERFSAGKQFCWQDEVYEVRRLLPGSNVKIINLRTGETQTVALVQLVKALFAGELRFVIGSQSATQAAKSSYIDWSDCPEALRAIAEYRMEVICPLLDLPPHQRGKAIRTRVKELKARRNNNERSLQTAQA
jgi:hypothetical protein